MRVKLNTAQLCGRQQKDSSVQCHTNSHHPEARMNYAKLSPVNMAGNACFSNVTCQLPAAVECNFQCATVHEVYKHGHRFEMIPAL
jgi:hypothetical protein